jgi:hypothetical protein
MNIFAVGINFLLNTFPTLYYISLFLGAASVLQVIVEVIRGAAKLMRKRINFR